MYNSTGTIIRKQKLKTKEKTHQALAPLSYRTEIREQEEPKPCLSLYGWVISWQNLPENDLKRSPCKLERGWEIEKLLVHTLGRESERFCKTKSFPFADQKRSLGFKGWNEPKPNTQSATCVRVVEVRIRIAFLQRTLQERWREWEKFSRTPPKKESLHTPIQSNVLGIIY